MTKSLQLRKNEFDAEQVATNFETTTAAESSPHIGRSFRAALSVLAYHGMQLDQTVEGGLRRTKRHLSSAECDHYLDGNWRIRIVK
jgi:hypothetical protein